MQSRKPALYAILQIVFGFGVRNFADAQSYSISTVAGTSILHDGGPATAAYLRSPDGVALDSTGNLYIADSADHRVRKVTPGGVISTFAGNGIGGSRGDGGPAAAARLDGPVAVAVDTAGNVYIADANASLVRKVAADGTITTVAGTEGLYEAAGDKGPATQAQLDPEWIAVDGSGNIYIADTYNDRIRMITAGTGVITTIAGTGDNGNKGDGGPANAAQLNGPVGISLDSAGNIYFCDQGNNLVRKIAVAGIITTVAGTGAEESSGDGGPATASGLFQPIDVAIDSAGNLLILTAESVRRVDASTSTISTIAGTGDIGFAGDGGLAASARFAFPESIVAAPNGDYIVADTGNFRVRRISNGTVNTIAGTDVQDGGPATSALLNFPGSMASDSSGNLYLADTGNNRVRKVTADGIISTVAGTGNPGSQQGRIAQPAGVTVDSQGNVFFSDTGNDRVQKLTPAGTLTVVAGTGETGFSGDRGRATAAQLDTPAGLAVDPQGNLYIADVGNLRVRKVDAGGVITTVAGTGKNGPSAGGLPATSTPMEPDGVAVDSAGNLYIADGAHDRVLQVAAADGIAHIVAGTGTAGYTGDGGAATSAQLDLPVSVAVDASGNLYIADSNNGVVRMVTPAGTISTIAGSGLLRVDNETGPATAAAIDPEGVAVDNVGNILVADTFNDRIRRLTPATSGASQSAAATTRRARLERRLRSR